MPENFEAYALAHRALPWSIDGMGSFNPLGIEAVLTGAGFEKGTEEYQELWISVSHFIRAWYSAHRKNDRNSNTVTIDKIKQAVGKENVRDG